MKTKLRAILGTLTIALLFSQSAQANSLAPADVTALAAHGEIALPSHEAALPDANQIYDSFNRFSFDSWEAFNPATVQGHGFGSAFSHHLAWWKIQWRQRPGWDSGTGGPSSVPDSGTTILLMALAFAGMGLLSRGNRDFTLPS